ncbi:MAG: transketolase family protein [Lachnospiraceae bacterium]|nr:transketolase family protein [Lachnospiraceae bacterium]
MASTFLRNVVGDHMTKLGEADERVIVVNADLMNTSRNRKFVERFPDRSFNVGIAEQFMVSFAAGLAHEGFIPYAFSMAPFMSMRACEQVRTDVAYADLNVRLIATYAGLSGGISGATHWSIEDVGIMRSIPNITILEPSDGIQAVKLLDRTIDHKGPVYMRISVDPVSEIYDQTYEPVIGRASVAAGGDDAAFICSGSVVSAAVEAAAELKKECGISVRVVDMHTIKPLDEEAVLSAAATGYMVVAQDHNIAGGLCEAVSTVLAKDHVSAEVCFAGISDRFVAMAHAPYLYHMFGYDREGLKEKMKNLLGITGQ